MCFVLYKEEKRWYYGSGNLKEEFCHKGVKSTKEHHEYVVVHGLDNSILVEESPVKPHPTQTYLPSSLRSIQPIVREEETETVHLLSPKRQRKSVVKYSPSVLNKNTSKQVTGPIKGNRVGRKLNVKSPSCIEKPSESDVKSVSFSEKRLTRK